MPIERLPGVAAPPAPQQFLNQKLPGEFTGPTIEDSTNLLNVLTAMVCQVKFTEWTRDDRLRQPVSLGMSQENLSKLARTSRCLAT